jgi:hypothetical protein
MEGAYVSAMAALAGSVIGGLTTGMTTWLNQRAQVRAGQIEHRIARLEDLFTDFIVATSRTYGEALITNEPKIEEIVSLYAMISKMRVLCRDQTVKRAERIMYATINTYYEPNKTVRDLHELIKSGVGIDPLKDFAEAARDELRSLR